MDKIVRMITSDGSVKAIAISGRDLVEKARQIHTTLPLATAALGRLLLAASMVGASVKEAEGSVTMKLNGGGPLGTVLAVSDNQGNVRGYVNDPFVDLPRKSQGKLDVGAGVGIDGSLSVIKDLGMKEPYIGTIPLVSGEIAEDLTSYFATSEQIPTACALGVLVDTDQSVLAAGGYIIQLLPGADDHVIDLLEEGISKVSHVSDILKENDDPAALLRAVLSSFETEVLDEAPVEYRCSCSRDRIEQILISLGKKELTEMIEQQGGAEVGCQFCGKKYAFSKDELQTILTQATKSE
jgi:molecular chaperone Hsp33